MVTHSREFSIRGFIAWVMWVLLHIHRLNGMRNRLNLMVNWALVYLFREYGVRLIIPSKTLPSKLRAAAESSDQIPQARVSSDDEVEKIRKRVHA